MLELLAEEDRQGAQRRAYPERPGVDFFRVEHQFAAVPRLPVGVEVGHQRDNTVGLALEGIEVSAVKPARRVMGEVAFEGEQAEEQPAVEIRAQLAGPRQPPAPGVRFAVDPADFILAHLSIEHMLLLPADAGRYELLRRHGVKVLQQVVGEPAW